MDTKDHQSNNQQPAAYDVEGRPLYYHPPQDAQSEEPESTAAQRPSHVTVLPESMEGQNFDPRIRSQYANEPDVVHTVRNLEPQPMVISEELQRKHEESVAQYPQLNLSEGEYVILDIKRHPIGIVAPIAITVVIIMVIFGFAFLYPSLITGGSLLPVPSPTAMFGIATLFAILAALGGAVALWVYLQNQFYMTNESVIQEIQESLFSRHEQTVSLGSIEDASFRQSGIIQMIFNYGTIRLSTEGEETTYIFHFVANPKHQIGIVNNAIEAFKNGRPVDD